MEGKSWSVVTTLLRLDALKSKHEATVASAMDAFGWI
jgi:hypothetical protein